MLFRSGYHPEPSRTGAASNRAAKERRVREGRAHAALVFDENGTAQGWCQYGSPEELPSIKHRRVYDKDAPHVDPEIFSLGVPVLGICYGLMLMAHHLGGKVVFTGRREYGAGVLHISKQSELFDGLGKELDVWNSHGDEVTALPKGFLAAGRTESSDFAAVEDRQRKLYGL